MPRHVAIAIACILALPASAQTATAPLTVTATVADTCDVTATTLDFGTLAQGSATGEATPGTVTLSCSANKASVTVSIGGGDNESAGLRRLGDGGANFIGYRIYSNAGRSAEVGVGGTLYSGTVSAATPLALSVYGEVPPGSHVAGSYTDSLVITFNY